MNTLFQPSSINSLQLKNRFIRSATWEGMCDDNGCPTPKLINHYQQLARGNVGLIITGYAIVREDGKQLPGTLGLHRSDFEDEMKELTKTVHDSGTKICAQLVHAGGQTDITNCGTTPISPSSLEVDQFPEKTKEMSLQDIEDLVFCFAQSALRAKNYGFDAVQLHAAHGYLINQFLSPLTNRRQDDYGGSEKKRCRFLLEVYQAVRKQVGDNFPVMMKLNCNDFLDGGVEPSQAFLAAELLDQQGIDCIEVSGGTPASGKKSPARMKTQNEFEEGYHLPLARELKKHVSCPIMVVGGMRSLEVMKQAVTNRDTDYISIARPFIRQPDLVTLFQNGEREKADCISCNGCFRPGLQSGGIQCVIKKKRKGEKENNSR